MSIRRSFSESGRHTLAYSILLTRKLHFSQYTNKCQQQGNSAAGCCQYK